MNEQRGMCIVVFHSAGIVRVIKSSPFIHYNLVTIICRTLLASILEFALTCLGESARDVAEEGSIVWLKFPRRILVY